MTASSPRLDPTHRPAETGAAKQDRREELLDRLTDHVLAAGIGNTGLRTLAAAVGTSDRMPIHYFTDKASLIAALLGNIAARLTARLEAKAETAPCPAR